MIVFTLCTSTEPFRVLSHQVGKSSISLVVEFSIVYNGKEQKNHQAYQGLVRKKFKKQHLQHYLSSNQKLASTQTLGSAFLDRVRKVQNSKYESDLFKIIDWFTDGYGSVNSERVNFSINFWLFLHKNLVKVNYISINCFSTNKCMLLFYKAKKINHFITNMRIL